MAQSDSNQSLHKALMCSEHVHSLLQHSCVIRMFCLFIKVRWVVDQFHCTTAQMSCCAGLLLRGFVCMPTSTPSTRQAAQFEVSFMSEFVTG